MADEQVIRLIQKLANMRVDRGCTPSEAAHAASKIEQLLEEHQLSMFDVSSQTFDEQVSEEYVEFDKARTPAWVWDLATACARPHECDVVMGWSGRTEKRCLKFIGHKSDAAISSFLYATLSKSLMDMADADGRRLGRYSHGLITFKSNFVSAAASVVRRRLQDERQKVRKATKAASSALVVVKKHAVDAFVKEHYPNLHIVPPSVGSEDVDAQVLGYRAGSRVELKKGIEEGDDALKIEN